LGFGSDEWVEHPFLGRPPPELQLFDPARLLS
jgi:hypothetical protein